MGGSNAPCPVPLTPALSRGEREQEASPDRCAGHIVRRHVRQRGVLPHGCALALLGFLVLVAAGGVYVIITFDSILARMNRSALDRMIEQLDLTAEQRERARAAVYRVPDTLQDGHIDRAQFRALNERIGESPEIYATGILLLKDRYFAPAQLPEEDEVEAVRQINRFCHGLLGGELSIEDARELETRFLVDPADRESGLRDALSADELRDVVALMRNRTEGLELSEEPIDIAAALRRAVDRAFAELEIEPPPKRER